MRATDKPPQLTPNSPVVDATVEIPDVERALALIGVSALIFGDIEKLRADDRKYMSTLERECTRLARELVHGEEMKMPQPDANYDKMLKALSSGVTADTIDAAIDAFPPNMRDVGAILGLHAKAIAAELLEFIPKSEYTTMTGTVPLPPSDTRLWRFFNIVDLLDDPLCAFALMSNGALLRSQAQAMHAVYPGLSMYIETQIRSEIEKAKAEKKSFELTPKAEYGLRSWMSLPPVSGKMLGYSQANASDLTKKADLVNRVQATPSHRALSQKAEWEATQTQKVENGV